MTKTIPSGHPENVANFETLISYCVGYGATYNPSNNNLKIPQLQTVLTTGKNVLLAVKTSKTAYDNACNSREIVITPLKKTSTRIINALEATTAAKQTINDVKTINHKIQGKQLSNTKEVTPQVVTSENATPIPEVNHISTTQQSIDSMIDNFHKLVVSISAEPLYIPNENELKVATLNALVTNLRAANTIAINTTTQYSNSRITRYTALYQPTIGLVNIALEVKKYVKSVYGATSPQYKQISGLPFKRYKQ